MTLDRRGFIRLVGGSALGAAAFFRPGLPGGTLAQTPGAATIAELVIDLDGAPDNLDPALTYSIYDWSIAHSIYDALLHFDSDGTIVPLAAESFTTKDAMTFDVTLRKGLTFHDGSPVTSAAITRAVDHLKSAKSQVTDLFAGITKVNEIDDLTAQIVTGSPSPWLPSQIAVWLMLFPEGAGDKTWTTAPVGSGPYKFVSYDPGNEVVLARNESYTWGSPKGVPLADKVTYRFVTESATRVADLSTKTAQIIGAVPIDQRDAVTSAGAAAVVEPILGTAFIRIATDTKPFDDARVRQALNYAVDLQTIATQLVAPEAKRLASIYPDPRGLGFDPNLKPFPYDPDKAKSLLAAAGHADGFKTTLEMVAGDSTDFAEAIVAQLADVGIEVEITQTELAAFNADWSKPTAAPLRYATWRPLYDPHTLLSLVFLSTGFLSRYKNAKADDLINGAAQEPDPEKRKTLYQQLGTLFQQDPAAIYLWNVVSGYGVAPDASAWQPRGDDYVIAVKTS